MLVLNVDHRDLQVLTHSFPTGRSSELKEAPGAITVAGTGTYSANQVAQTTFDKAVGIKTTYIPFTGTSATTAALLGKQVKAQLSFTTDRKSTRLNSSH